MKWPVVSGGAQSRKSEGLKERMAGSVVKQINSEYQVSYRNAWFSSDTSGTICATKLDCADDLVHCAEMNGRIKTANRAWLATLGYSMAEISGLHVWDIVHEDHREEIRDLYWRFWNGENVGPFETVFRSKSGESIAVEGSLNRQEIEGYSRTSLDIFRDISDRKHIERAKDEAIFVAAHELRTPITAITLALELISTTGTDGWDKELRDILSIATANADRLTDMVNGLLDLRKIQVSGIALDFEENDVNTSLREAAVSLFAIARRSGVEIVTHETDAIVNADTVGLSRILTNLVSNAVKFSPQGSRVTLSGQEKDGDVLFSVSDNGRGIPDEFKNRIFGLFQQAETADATEKGGSGLGLSITRKLVEQHGGRIWFESAYGSGTTFFFTLPSARSHRSLAEAI